MEKYFGKKSIIYSGNPVKTITISNKPKIKRNILLITGGSQGSKKLNLDILTLLPLLKELKLEIVWSTGKHNYESIYQSLKPHVHKNNIIIYEGLNIRLEPYIDDLSNLLPEVKIAISRAGAMSISELIANEIPTIYIPYPYATHNHQYENAKFITDNQAGLLLNETEVQPTIMHMMINTLISGYQNYCNNIKKLNTNSAIDQIVTELSNRGYL
ncbi:MAG: hypothetical protein A2Y40_09885 [Candidatus Margulisbacteria bacterium GWF2_35_9]|nr:MAG: hypothetical protein A2Y40_09885 [Candidatus Margulisbacteria bacterium GWF2_35_9]